MSTIVSGGQTDATVQGNMFQELDKDKNLIFEWRSWDHFKFQDAEEIELTGKIIDYVHMNSIAIDYDNNYIISSRHLSEVTKIDRQTGEIIWRFGGVNNQFEIINDDLEFSYQHCVRPVPDKPNYYTMFDNGNKRNPRYARAVEYRLDTTNMAAAKVWEFRYSPDRYSYMMGSVQILPNDNRFIDWSTALEMRACEVTPDGEIMPFGPAEAVMV